MNEKQAAMIGDLMKKPKFAMLQGLCSELTQAQDNALNHKHKALHMQMITFTNQALDKTSKAHKASSLGSSAPTKSPVGASNPGLGSSAPSAPSNSGVGDAPAPGDGGEFNPANWDVPKYGVDHYVKTLYYLYDKLRTTESGNPNALIYFLEGLSKLSQYGGSNLLDQFTSGLCKQLGAFSQIFGSAMPGASSKSTSAVPFATLIAFALVTLAIYQASQNGGSTKDVLAQIQQYMNGPLSGGNPFLAQIKSVLTKMMGSGAQVTPYAGGQPVTYTIDMITKMLFAHSGASYKNGLPALSKILLQQILESLFGGTQGAADPDAIENSQAAVRQAFSEGVLEELSKLEKDGDNLAELIDFVMMQYNLASDDAGAYVGNINDLSALEGDTSTILGLFAPGKYVGGGTSLPAEIQDFMSHLSAYYRLTDMWPAAPNIAGGGEGSLEDILSGQLLDNLGSLKCGADVLKLLGMPNAKGTVMWHGLTFDTNESFRDLMAKFKTIFLQQPGSDLAKSAAQLMITIIGQRNNEPESTSASDQIVKRDGSLDSIVSSLQAVESQVSSANETAKSEYQQANQTSANMLSTGGDMMKDLMKMFTSSVQNQKAGV